MTSTKVIQVVGDRKMTSQNADVLVFDFRVRVAPQTCKTKIARMQAVRSVDR